MFCIVCIKILEVVSEAKNSCHCCPESCFSLKTCDGQITGGVEEIDPELVPYRCVTPMSPEQPHNS
jgi:hypothetical protein